MKVVTEDVDQVDRVVPCVLVRVSRKEHERNVADVFAGQRVGVLQLHRRILVAEQHLRSSVVGASALFEFLHEHLGAFGEDGGLDSKCSRMPNESGTREARLKARDCIFRCNQNRKPLLDRAPES